MNNSSPTHLATDEAILKTYPASHLSARQENAKNLASALGMISAHPSASQHNKQETQLSLDLLPHRITEKDWNRLETGLIQTARTLQSFLQDIYSKGKILKQPRFPFEQVLSYPGFLREYRSFSLPNQLHLRFIAIDLVQENLGKWYIKAFHLALPAGIAYTLQNRRIQNQVFPELMEATHVLPISHFPTQLLENAQSTALPLQNHIALLSDASTRHHEFEHAFLARKMGIALARFEDLIVRDTALHYKTISGLQPIHTLLHFTKSLNLDPIITGKQTGIAGLFHSWRSGQTQLINPLGNTVAENPFLFPWLTEMTRFYLKEDTLLEPLPIFSSSNPSHYDKLKDNPENFSFYYPHPLRPIKNPTLALKNLPLLAHPKLNLATLPYLGPYGTLASKPFTLRCFLLIDKNNICVLPGGLTQLNKKSHLLLNTPYLAKDTWIISSKPPAPLPYQPADFSLFTAQALGSRTAESLYWMGRYTERAECTARMFSVLDEVRLESIKAHHPLWKPLWDAISHSGGYNEVFFKKLLKFSSDKIAFHLTLDSENSASLLSSVRQAQQNANALQDYISPEAWTVINRLEQTLTVNAKQSTTYGASAMIAIRRGLETALNQLAAFRGMILRTMLQDTGNGFFYTGLYVERILMTTQSLKAIYQSNLTHLSPEEHEIENPIFNAFLRMMGIQDAYHRKYQRRAQSLRVAEILLKEKQSPASLIFCAQRLSDFFTQPIGNFENGHKIATTLLKQLTKLDPLTPKNLTPLLYQITDQALHLHELISDTFFQHQTPGELKIL